jgi:hypothetical protein
VSPRQKVLQATVTVVFVLVLSTTQLSAQSKKKDRKRDADAKKTSSRVKVKCSDADFRRRVSDVAQTLADVRQLKFRRPINAGVLERDELPEVIEELSDEDEDFNERIDALQPLLVRLGLVPRDLKLREFMEELSGDAIAGFYNPERKELFMIADEEDRADGDNMVIAHELTHALQDQHYDLTKMKDQFDGEDDMELAFEALVEGDATVAMMEYEIAKQEMGPFARVAYRGMTNLAMSNMGLLSSLLGTDDEDALARAPNIIKQELIFPYSSGLRFVRHGMGGSKWNVVAEAYKQPPLSTEQILHPPKYFDKVHRDWPQQVITPDVGVLLPGKWMRVSRLVTGEFGVRGVLAEFSAPYEAPPNQVAAGWDGDEVKLYRDRTNPKRLMMTWYTTWDNEDEAVEFEKALSIWVAARHNDALPVDGAANCWQVGSNQVRVERNGTDVILIDAPCPDRHAAISAALWDKVWKKEIQSADQICPL